MSWDSYVNTLKSYSDAVSEAVIVGKDGCQPWTDLTKNLTVSCLRAGGCVLSGVPVTFGDLPLPSIVLDIFSLRKTRRKLSRRW